MVQYCASLLAFLHLKRPHTSITLQFILLTGTFSISFIDSFVNDNELLTFLILPPTQVVEQTKNEKTQADTLSVVLSLQYSSAFHARAMAEESGFALLKRILLSPECRIGYHTLKVCTS